MLWCCLHSCVFMAVLNFVFIWGLKITRAAETKLNCRKLPVPPSGHSKMTDLNIKAGSAVCCSVYWSHLDQIRARELRRLFLTSIFYKDFTNSLVSPSRMTQIVNNLFWPPFFSPNQPTGPNRSSSCNVCPSVCLVICLSPSHAIFYHGPSMHFCVDQVRFWWWSGSHSPSSRFHIYTKPPKSKPVYI